MSKSKILKLSYNGGHWFKGVHYEGFTSAIDENDKSIYLGQLSWDHAMAKLEDMGYCCKDIKAYLDSRVKGPLPGKPENVTHFQHGYGYRKVKEILKWDWSTTFGRWGASVIFEGEDHSVFSYPKIGE